MENSLNRRGFLRLCAVTAGGVVVAACQQSLQDIATVTQAVALGTPVPLMKLNLTGADQDVWMWIKPVEGVVSGECSKLAVEINGSQLDTQSDGKMFRAQVKLSPGANKVSATCMQPDGVQIRSNMLNYTERLRQVPTAVIDSALDGEMIVLDGSKSQPAVNDQSKIVAYLWSRAREIRMCYPWTMHR